MIDEWGKGAKYWDKAWNPMIGCHKVSEGCQNCYAEGMSGRFPELRDADGGFAPHCPTSPKCPPRKGVVFVGNMTDIFGEWNDFDMIFGWMSQFCGGPYLVLTKRVERMYQYLCKHYARWDTWYGMTAENQELYKERIKTFRGITKASGLHRWLSAEPLLGPIDMQLQYIPPKDMPPFDWVVVGAESGPNRRPCKIEWVDSIVWQCRMAGIPVFVKQLEIDGKLEKDIAKFPKHLQIRQVPWKAKVQQ